jgi:ATP-dependent Lon protease
VRELERQLHKIARKLAVKLQYDEKIKLHVNTEIAKEYLGKILYDYNSKDDTPLPGVVNGMAYTTAGGDLLPIEVTYFDGKGNISITGNLKETMKESAQVALGYVRANAIAFGISKDFDFSKVDIHIHVPSGGIPKDGPSAGVTLTTAIISAITKRVVPNTLAMTGEITLRGKVGIIGGVREKIISAFRGGVNEFFIPKDDERFIDEVPQEVKEKITINFVENYMQIYQVIFEGKVLGKTISKKAMS